MYIVHLSEHILIYIFIKINAVLAILNTVRLFFGNYKYRLVLQYRQQLYRPPVLNYAGIKTKLQFVTTNFLVRVWFLAFCKKMVLFFTDKNKNHGSGYKQEWELFGSYFGFFQLFRLFSLILAYLELMVLIFTVVLNITPKLTRNKNHRFFGRVLVFFFLNLSLFAKNHGS